MKRDSTVLNPIVKTKVTKETDVIVKMHASYARAMKKKRKARAKRQKELAVKRKEKWRKEKEARSYEGVLEKAKDEVTVNTE